jgi:hypothetical protein
MHCRKEVLSEFYDLTNVGLKLGARVGLCRGSAEGEK